MWMDGRIQVRFADRRSVQPAADQILVIAEDPGAEAIMSDIGSGWGKVVRLAAPPLHGVPHGAGCVCCGPGSPWVTAFAALFQARARGEVVFFRAMVVDLPHQHADRLRRLLISESYLAAYFVQTREG